MKSIPTKEEIYCYGMPEEEYAVQHFYGKSEEEAAELFFLYPEYYGSDLRWMGVKAYFYYIGSIKKYLQSEEGKSDDIFIDIVVDTLKSRLERELDFRSAFKKEKDNILNILVLIKSIIEQKKFNEIDNFYEDLPSKVINLIELCKK